MKKLIAIALIGLALTSCKKTSGTTNTAISDSVKVTITNLPANTTYSIDGFVLTTHLLTINGASTNNKSYSVPVSSGQSITFNWSFVLNSLYQGNATFTIIHKGATVYTSTGYAGSYGFAIQ